jgi:hypothetical protein
MSSTPDSAGRLRFSTLGQGFMVTKLLLLAGRIGLDAAMAKGAMSVEELAGATGCHAPTLGRMLRALAAVDIVRLCDDGRFEPTELLSLTGNLLAPGFDESAYHAWHHAEHSLRTGKAAYPRAFGRSLFENIADDEPTLDAFVRWNTRTAAERLPQILPLARFDRFTTVADLGGGEGRFIADLLKAYPHLSGILFERREVAERARRLLEREGLAGRCTIAAGDFGSAVPTGADAYSLCRVLLNWSDEEAQRILSVTRRAMAPGAALIVVDMIVPGRNHPAHLISALSDLNLLINFGGTSRTEAEWQALVEGSGFRIERLSLGPPESMFVVIEAYPRGAS